MIDNAIIIIPIIVGLIIIMGIGWYILLMRLLNRGLKPIEEIQ